MTLVSGSVLHIFTTVLLLAPALVGGVVNNCDETYEGMIVYGFEDCVPVADGFLVPTDPLVNTLEFRTLAYAYFEDNYGLVFDPNNDGDQTAAAVDGNLVQVKPLNVNPDLEYRILGYDIRVNTNGFPRKKRRLQTGNALIRDYVYMVTPAGTVPVTVNVGGGPFGTDIVLAPPPAGGGLGHAIIFGKYDILVDGVVEASLYFNNPFGDIVFNDGRLNCEIFPIVPAGDPLSSGQAWGFGRVVPTDIVGGVPQTLCVESKNVIVFGEPGGGDSCDAL